MAKKKFLFKAQSDGYEPDYVPAAVVNFELLDVDVSYDVKAKLTIVPPREAAKPGAKPRKPVYRQVLTMPAKKKG